MIDELIGQNQVGMICLYSSKEVMRLYEKYGLDAASVSNRIVRKINGE